jgi:8-oxo-dGTP diphosphatase
MKREQILEIVQCYEDYNDMVDAILALEQPIEQSERKTAEIDKQKYVVGFMFTEDCSRVVLIRKNKPAWQKGKLNGVGGKIEPEETPKHAMIREYKEEAGLTFDKWDNFLIVEYKAAIVYFFKGFNNGCFHQSETRESEQIEKIQISQFPSDEVISNLNWIINLALDPYIQHTEAMEEYRQQPKVTDEEIDAFYNQSPGNKIHPDRYKSEGAKAMRDGLIPKR